MTATTLSAIRDALKFQLDGHGIEGLETADIWPDFMNMLPGGCLCVVNPVSVEYGQVFGAVDRSIYIFELHLFVAMGGGIRPAQDVLDPYISNGGAKSILQAIRDDPYLGLEVAYCLPPTRVRSYGVKALGPSNHEIEVLGAVIDLEVHANAA